MLNNETPSTALEKAMDTLYSLPAKDVMELNEREIRKSLVRGELWCQWLRGFLEVMAAQKKGKS